MIPSLRCAGSYLSSVFWSHCKQTTAALSCPDHPETRYTQMLRSFWLWAGVTVVHRLHAIQHRNSVSTRETWQSGGVNLVRRDRQRWLSAESRCVSGGTRAVMKRGSWFWLVSGSRCGGCAELPDECMRLRDSSVNNETLPGCWTWRHIRFQRDSANQWVTGRCVCSRRFLRRATEPGKATVRIIMTY